MTIRSSAAIGSFREMLLAGIVLALATIPGGILSAAAQEYCVVCSSPDAVYRCQIAGARPNSGVPLKLRCVTELARLNNHDACKIKGGTVFQCDGKIVQVSVPADLKESPQATAGRQPVERPVARPPAPPQAAQAQPLPAPERPPNADRPPVVESKPVEQPAPPQQGPAKTVEGVAKDVVRKSGETISKTGEVVKKAAKKTWNCLSSLFTSC